MVIGRDGTALTDSNQILKDLTTGKAALAPLGGIGEEMGDIRGTVMLQWLKYYRQHYNRAAI